MAWAESQLLLAIALGVILVEVFKGDSLGARYQASARLDLGKHNPSYSLRHPEDGSETPLDFALHRALCRVIRIPMTPAHVDTTVITSALFLADTLTGADEDASGRW